jgi:uncharacterized protein (TIGR00730 family)
VLGRRRRISSPCDGARRKGYRQHEQDQSSLRLLRFLARTRSCLRRGRRTIGTRTCCIGINADLWRRNPWRDGRSCRGTLDNGGKVGAIIPRFLTNWETTTDALKTFEDLTITDTMHERKHRMFERSDAFVALPGGIGTIEEIVEIMTWAQLGQHRKPMVLVNIKGFWAPMMAMLNHIRNAGFLHRDHLLQPIVVDRAEDVIPAIVAAAAKDGAPKAGGSSIIDKM